MQFFLLMVTFVFHYACPRLTLFELTHYYPLKDTPTLFAPTTSFQEQYLRGTFFSNEPTMLRNSGTGIR